MSFELNQLKKSNLELSTPQEEYSILELDINSNLSLPDCQIARLAQQPLTVIKKDVGKKGVDWYSVQQLEELGGISNLIQLKEKLRQLIEEIKIELQPDKKKVLDKSLITALSSITNFLAFIFISQLPLIPLLTSHVSLAASFNYSAELAKGNVLEKIPTHITQKTGKELLKDYLKEIEKTRWLPLSIPVNKKIIEIKKVMKTIIERIEDIENLNRDRFVEYAKLLGLNFDNNEQLEELINTMIKFEELLNTDADFREKFLAPYKNP